MDKETDLVTIPGNNGNYYIGEFKDGLKHGYGFWCKSKEPKSNQYRGDFLNDKKWGYGVFRWTSGSIYKGNYRNDEREGYGEMYWTDGSVYKGEWHNGIQHGYGTMIFPDKTFIKGYFKNNLYLGEKMDKTGVIRSKQLSNELSQFNIINSELKFSNQKAITNLNAKIKGDRMIKPPSENREIEAYIYNLPKINDRIDDNHPILSSLVNPKLPKIENFIDSSKVVSNKLSEIRRSIESYTPHKNELYYSANLVKLNSSVPQKNRNTYVGFPLDENPRFGNKNRHNKRNKSKNKRKYNYGYSKKRIMNGLAKMSK